MALSGDPESWWKTGLHTGTAVGCTVPIMDAPGFPMSRGDGFLIIMDGGYMWTATSGAGYRRMWSQLSIVRSGDQRWFRLRMPLMEITFTYLWEVIRAIAWAGFRLRLATRIIPGIPPIIVAIM